MFDSGHEVDDAGTSDGGEIGDAGIPDASTPMDAGTADSGVPYCLPLYTTGAVVLDDAGCPPLPTHPDLLDEALAHWNIDRCSFGNPSYQQLISRPGGFNGYSAPDPFTLPYYYLIHDNPLLAPSFVRNLTADLDAAATSEHPVSRSIAALAGRLGKRLFVCDRTTSLAPEVGDGQPLAHAVAALISANGGTANEAELEISAEGMPTDLQIAVATIVNELAEAPAALTEYLASSGVSSPESFGQRLQGLPYLDADFAPNAGLPVNPGVPADFAALAALDIEPLAHYAADLALTVESLGLPRFRDAMAFFFSAQTPLGAVVVSDGTANTYEPTDPNLGGNILLLLDTGGDDVYRVPLGANQPLATGLNAPVSLAIDLGGSDTYAYDVVSDPNDTGGRLPSDGSGRFAVALDAGEGGPISFSTTGRQGSGIVGVGMLFDYGPESDQYQSLRLSQGFGAAGVGVLFDEGGNDTYTGEDSVQGAALFGIGLLLDLTGNDSYTTYHDSQGYAYTAGVGALVDMAGDDVYVANVGDPALGGDPLYYSPQLPGYPAYGNSSESQGMATGFRDTISMNGQLYLGPGAMSGGLGVLRDAQGNDRYVGSVFAQGAGYFLGFGVLVDSAGDDQYDALVYAQGIAVHNALSFFWDESGDDRYNQNFAPIMADFGEGDDFGVSIHVDNGGNDTVTGTGVSLGSSDYRGTGIYINNGGNDLFNGGGQSFGQVGQVSEPPSTVNYRNYGIFLKAGGQGTYTVNGAPASPDFAGSGTSRFNPDAGPWYQGYAFFVDDPDAGSVQLP